MDGFFEEGDFVGFCGSGEKVLGPLKNKIPPEVGEAK
jgi:hypothetical protein